MTVEFRFKRGLEPCPKLAKRFLTHLGINEMTITRTLQLPLLDTVMICAEIVAQERRTTSHPLDYRYEADEHVFTFPASK